MGDAWRLGLPNVRHRVYEATAFAFWLPAALGSAEKKNTLSAALPVESSIGGLGLIKPIVVGEQRIDINSPLDDEIGASFLVQ